MHDALEDAVHAVLSNTAMPEIAMARPNKRPVAECVRVLSRPSRTSRSNPMLICQLTDLHVRPDEAAANLVPDTNMLTERACRVVAAFTPLPDVVIITGDLTDSGQEAEYANLSAILARTLSVPVYVVPGNHDQRETLRASLAHLPGVNADPHFVQYAVEDYPVRLVMLDTLVPGKNHGAQSAAQLEW